MYCIAEVKRQVLSLLPMHFVVLLVMIDLSSAFDTVVNVIFLASGQLYFFLVLFVGRADLSPPRGQVFPSFRVPG